MSDLHDDRIAEMIDDLDDGHIRVVLDFIPVEERLPTNGRPVLGVTCSPMPTSTNEPILYEMSYWENVNSPLEPPSAWHLSGGLKPCWPVTHWAEMPKIEVSDD